MKKVIPWIYAIVSIVIFMFSLFENMEYFYELANDNLILYQMKQVASVLFLYVIGYLFLKAVQDYLNNMWIALLAMPCGIAIWVFVGQFLFMTNITYMMHRMLILIVACLLVCFGMRRIFRTPVKGSLLPGLSICLGVIGTAFLVSTGFNYINMNFDSYLYFADYGKMMAWAGDYREWNTPDAYVITNIGQFLPTLNSYSAFWGLEYCVAIQSFMSLNMYAVFAYAVYEVVGERLGEKARLKYTVLFTAAFVTCTCVLVYGNWMLSNAFLMYYLILMGIFGAKAPEKVSLDYVLTLSGSALAITLLRKDGIIIVCFMAICYCCNKTMKSGVIMLSILPSIIAQVYYIGYVRLFLHAQSLTARGTSILNNKFVLMILACITLTMIYIMLVHPMLQCWLKEKLFLFLLCVMIAVVTAAVLIKFMTSVDHIDAVLHVLISEPYGISIFIWLLFSAMILMKKQKIDYGIFLLCGYCMLTFLIYWNKGNTEKGIDNSGMRMFVQVVPLIYYFAADKLVEIVGNGFERWRKE